MRDRIAAGKTTVLVPIGGTEQNGPHMALGKHNARAKALAERIAAALGQRAGRAGHRLCAGGQRRSADGAHALSGNHHDSRCDLRDSRSNTRRAASSVAGFRDIVFLGDHGGYQKELRAVADRLNREWAATPVRAHAILEYYRATETAYVKALKRRGYSDAEIGTHAGLADTSLALAVDPLSCVRSVWNPAAKLDASDGVYGDPRRASAELGRSASTSIVARPSRRSERRRLGR